MSAKPGKRSSILIIATLTMALVGVCASRALACEPEGYAAELRTDGELPGGG